MALDFRPQPFNLAAQPLDLGAQPFDLVARLVALAYHPEQRVSDHARL